MTSSTISSPALSWHNYLYLPTKINALYHNGKFSDLTITFPGQGIEYKAHRLIMAISSTIFEQMLFGPMAIKGSVLELPDDDPEVFKIVLGSCYDVHIKPSDLDEALKVYMLANKYFMEDLESNCVQNICKLINSENVNKVLEFASHFNFDYLKQACFQALKLKFHFDFNAQYSQYSNTNFDQVESTKILLVLQPDWLKELLESDIEISHLVFLDSWMYPDKTTLCEDIVMEILKSNGCNNIGLKKFSGCVSAKVVSNICWREKDIWSDTNFLHLSFTNHQQANEVISVLSDERLSDGKFNLTISIHLQCSKFPADLLMRLPLIKHRPEMEGYMHALFRPNLFISNVDDHVIEWVVSAARSLMPQGGLFNTISFPESKLTFSGITTIRTRLESVGVKYCFIKMCSSELQSYTYYDQLQWITDDDNRMLDGCLSVYDRNEDIPYWYKQNEI